MILGQMVNINKGDIVSVVGSGGKTSFINYYANYYKNKFKVLLTTTTKIYIPKFGTYEYMYITSNSKEYRVPTKNGITVCGKTISKQNKIIGLDFKELDVIIPKFDITFIESDGSKKKKIKGWNNTVTSSL
ncbi:MAG: selenium cofactor biosynthesis protein YqeC [Romboutsia sp.]